MTELDRAMLRRAARLALRGHGGAEPNPLVGCVVADAAGRVAGEAGHRRCGGPHAEALALAAAGARARGGTAWVTLEPCAHHGRTPPCADALIAAGVARVVYARRDLHELAAGGAERLRAAGVAVELLEEPSAVAVAEPWARRRRTGRPWVVAKWAQTLDGRIAASNGASRWISGAASRRLLHRERGRVDAIMTGIGTVLSDDPDLTARGVRRRRIARRVVVDPRLETPTGGRLVASLDRAPLHLVAGPAAPEDRAASLVAAGAEVLRAPAAEIDLDWLLRELAARWDVAHVLVEAGPGLLSRLFARSLVDEAWVFVAPRLLGDDSGVPPLRGFRPESIAAAQRLELVDRRTRGEDVVLRYRCSAE